MSEGLLGVIIGAIAAIAGGLLGELVKYKLEKQLGLIKQRSRVYEHIQKCIVRVDNGCNYFSTEQQLKDIEEMSILTSLYASPEVKKEVDILSEMLLAERSEILIKDITNQSLKIEKLMRRDLAIND